MSSSNKRFYWLQLPEDFFNDKTVKKLRKIPGGDTYTIIALKIMLKALKDENKLYYDGIEDSFAEEIALDIDEQAEAVEITIKYLIQSGWLVAESSDTLVSVKGAELTGSETASTRRSRKHRAMKAEQSSTLLNTPDDRKALQCNADATPMQRNCNGDIDIEKEIEKERNIDNSLRSLSSPAPSKENAGTTPKKPHEPIFIQFPVLGGKYADIPESWCDEMQELYGNSVNIRHEIKLAIAWCSSNQKKKDWKRFLNNWFSNCLKRGGSVVPYEETERTEEKEEEPVQMSEEDKRLEERIAALSKDFMRAIKEGRREDANRINEEKSRLMREKFKNSKAEWEGCVYEDQ